MSLYRGIGTALVASSSRTPIARRSITTALPTLRQQTERLPHGHIRPHRRPAATQRSPTSSQDYEAPTPVNLPGLSVPPRPVSIPNDPKGVLQESHAARELLGHETLVIVRQIEMLNVFMGFEQANRYAIQTPEGEVVGFLAEEEQSIISTMSRQFLRTHRPFRAVVMDRTGKPILWIRRPFQIINSRISVRSSEAEDGKLVGEAQQEWHPWRRRYNIFQSRDEETFSQFARVDSGFFAWDFWLQDRDNRLVASINRNFRGLGRELFTDTGQYVIRFDSAGTELDLPPGSSANVQGQALVLPEGKDGGLTLDQRAMTLATAVSVDFDYFSRHSGSGGMGFPFLMWGGGDGSSDVQQGGQQSGTPDGAAAGAAGAAGLGEMSEDEQIYGRQPTGADGQAAQGGNSDSRGADEGLGSPDEQGWDVGNEEGMQDPWGSQGEDSGWFGSGDGGSDWGGGDWS